MANHPLEEGKTIDPIKAPKAKKVAKKNEYRCLALKNRKCHMNGTDYLFEEDKMYTLTNSEHVEKLTAPLNGTLRLIE